MTARLHAINPGTAVKTSFVLPSLTAALLLGGFFVSTVSAQTGNSGAKPAATTTNAAETPKPATSTARPAVEVRQMKPTISPGIADIIKMLDAGVSSDVIKAYIENSSSAWNPTPADLIALKDHGVTDEVTMALMKKFSEAKSRLVAQNAVQESKAAARYGNAGYLDPESYEFFHYYYLFPRTLAYSQQTLGYGPGYGGGFGYYPAAPYGAYYGPGYVYPRRFFTRRY